MSDFYCGLKRSAVRDFSIAKFIHGLGKTSHQTGNEFLVAEQMADQFGDQARKCVPWPMLRSQRDNMTSTGTIGGHLAPSTITDYGIALRNAPLIEKLGCKVTYSLQGSARIPRVSSGVSAATATEGGGFSQTTIEFENPGEPSVAIASAKVICSRLLWKVSPVVESLVRDELVAAINKAIDTAILSGDGTAGAPTGLIYDAVPEAFATVAGGLAPTRDNFVSLSEAVAAADGLQGSCAYVTTHGVRAKLRDTATSGTGDYDWQPDRNDPTGLSGFVDDQRAYSTSALPDTLTSGTLTATASPALFGNWGDLELFYHSPGVILTVNDVSNPHTVEIQGEVYFSGAPRRLGSFCKTDNLVLS